MGGQVISAESANLADIFGSFCSSLSKALYTTSSQLSSAKQVRFWYDVAYLNCTCALSLQWYRSAFLTVTTINAAFHLLIHLGTLQSSKNKMKIASFPGLPSFLLSVCIHNDTQKQKRSDKQGNPSLFHFCAFVNANCRVKKWETLGNMTTSHLHYEYCNKWSKPTSRLRWALKNLNFT